MAGFEDDLKKLESVVEKLERGELTLDQSVKLFEEGMKLSNACKEELDKAEGRFAGSSYWTRLNCASPKSSLSQTRGMRWREEASMMTRRFRSA